MLKSTVLPVVGIFNKTRGAWVARKVEKADTFWSRAKGLLGRESLDPEGGMWLDPCTSVHGFFMAFPIDIAFLDAGLKVVRVERLPAWGLSSWVRRARSVLELPEGAGERLKAGDVLEVRSS